MIDSQSYSGLGCFQSCNWTCSSETWSSSRCCNESIHNYFAFKVGNVDFHCFAISQAPLEVHSILKSCSSYFRSYAASAVAAGTLITASIWSRSAYGAAQG